MDSASEPSREENSKTYFGFVYNVYLLRRMVQIVKVSFLEDSFYDKRCLSLCDLG